LPAHQPSTKKGYADWADLSGFGELIGLAQKRRTANQHSISFVVNSKKTRGSVAGVHAWMPLRTIRLICLNPPNPYNPSSYDARWVEEMAWDRQSGRE
jgi:hypothetical protein